MTVITTATQLQNMKNNLADNYELGNDINCSGIANFEPVGGWNAQAAFAGSFDGKGYKISNLTVNRAADDSIGLFGETSGCSFMGNVTLENFTLTGDDDIGALCGCSYNHSISNVTVINVTISGGYDCGGMIGCAIGLAGQTITNCSSTGSVTGNSYWVGGLFGDYYLYATSDCHSSVNVVSTLDFVGGLVGQWWTGTFNKCYATGTVTGDAYVGGFAGQMRGAVGTETASRCFATGVVTSTFDYAGGFVGAQIDGEINDCYALGTAKGNNYVGGFAGISNDVNRCYSIGSITHGVAQTNTGGFTGSNGETLYRCFWDKTTSGEATGAGGGTPQTGLTGHITATMKLLATFSEAGWSIPSIWNVLSTCTSGYPCLVGVNPCCPPSAAPPVDATIAPKKVSRELIANIEMQFGGRFYIDKSGNAVYESRYKRGS